MVIFKNDPIMQYQIFSFRKESFVTLLIAIFATVAAPPPSQAQVGKSVRQVIVAQAASWDSHTASLQCWQRTSAREPWQPVFPQSVPVLLGKKGLAWGRGVFTPPQNGIPAKIEKTGKLLLASSNSAASSATERHRRDEHGGLISKSELGMPTLMTPATPTTINM